MQHQVLLHLSLINGIGPQAVQKIIECMQNSDWDCAYTFSLHDWIQLGLSASIAQKIVVGLRNRHDLENELALIEKYAINWISILDEHYPALLRHIYMPPPILYWRGDLSDYEHRIAVVGARKTNWYGQQVIEAIGPALVAHNFQIVSGGAIGADTMAHQ